LIYIYKKHTPTTINLYYKLKCVILIKLINQAPTTKYQQPNSLDQQLKPQQLKKQKTLG